jgi:uncharacterized protein (TIGR03000 family)
MNKYLLSLILGVTGMLVTPGDSHAQRWGWGGGRGGVGISVGNSPYYYGSGLGYNNWGYNPGFGYSNYGYSNYGYRPSYYGTNYSNWPSNYGSYYGYRPSYYGTTYTTLPSYYGSSYSNYAPSYAYVPSSGISSPQTSTSFYYSPSQEQSALMDKAAVEVHVPADAELWIDGQPTTQRGETRTFETPQFAVGRGFSYELRARWMEDGKPVDETRRVELQPGERQVLDFRKK